MHMCSHVSSLSGWRNWISWKSPTNIGVAQSLIFSKRGSKLIDGVWKLVDSKCFYFSDSIGDHRTIIFDVSTRSVIEKFEHRVVRSACRRLNTNTSNLSKYNTIHNPRRADDQAQDGWTHKYGGRRDRKKPPNSNTNCKNGVSRQAICQAAETCWALVKKDTEAQTAI